jgi:hypothetical protein
MNGSLAGCQHCHRYLPAKRQLFAPLALKALARCHAEGGRMWVYTGSVQTLEYSLARGLIHQAASRKNVLSDGKPGNGIMTF